MQNYYMQTSPTVTNNSHCLTETCHYKFSFSWKVKERGKIFLQETTEMYKNNTQGKFRRRKNLVPLHKNMYACVCVYV